MYIGDEDPLKGNTLLKNLITTVYFIILFHKKTPEFCIYPVYHTTQWFSNAHVPFLLRMGDAQLLYLLEFPKMSWKISKSFTKQRFFSWI